MTACEPSKRPPVFALWLLFGAACTSPVAPSTSAMPSVVPGAGAAPPDTAVSCIGPETATDFVIYLHGVDSPSPSEQELGNRAVLARLAETYDLRIALPRSSTPCPAQAGAGSLCWGWKFDKEELAAVVPRVIESRKTCFAADRSFGMIGFSNGGYLLVKWYATGLQAAAEPLPRWLIAAGSGKGQIGEREKDLSRNPPLTFTLGTADQYNFDPEHVLFHQLVEMRGPVDEVIFPGGHLLDETALGQALAEHAVRASR